MNALEWTFFIGAALVAVGLGAIKWFLAPIFFGAVLMFVTYQAISRQKPLTT